MQKYWTLLKIVLLGLGLGVFVYTQRSPSYVSVWGISDEDGNLAALEIDGQRISLGPADGQNLYLHFQNVLASRGDEHPWIQLRFDDNLNWRDADGVLSLVLTSDREPRVSIVDKFGEELEAEQNLVVNEPGIIDSRGNDRVIQIRQPRRFGEPRSEIFFESGASLTHDQLSDRILSLIGDPDSEKARNIQISINPQIRVPFRDVRAVLRAVSGKRSTWTGKWQPYVRNVRLNHRRWRPDNTKFGRVTDALTSATPRRAGGG
ncbi:MAG: hypothetical protein H8E37_05800 [Planctomycetes bacterium]|nr:hypothetical protein [Planctomycetota bacterium]